MSYYRINSPKFSPKHMGIESRIFEYCHYGYNNIQVFKCPLKHLKGEPIDFAYGWLHSTFVIRIKRVEKFLSRCEYLGEDFPYWLLSGQPRHEEQLDLF